MLPGDQARRMSTQAGPGVALAVSGLLALVPILVVMEHETYAPKTRATSLKSFLNQPRPWGYGAS